MVAWKRLIGLLALAGLALSFASGVDAQKAEKEKKQYLTKDQRLALIRHAMDTLFGGRPAFRCCWTYINAVRPTPTPGRA